MNKIKDNDSRISEMNFLKARKQVEIANIQAELRQQEKVLDELIARARLQTGYDQVKSFVEKKGITLDAERLQSMILNQTRRLFTEVGSISPPKIDYAPPKPKLSTCMRPKSAPTGHKVADLRTREAAEPERSRRPATALKQAPSKTPKKFYWRRDPLRISSPVKPESAANLDDRTQGNAWTQEENLEALKRQSGRALYLEVVKEQQLEQRRKEALHYVKANRRKDLERTLAEERMQASERIMHLATQKEIEILQVSN
mmetsp:Transcript_37504/g.118267  ORF Transcript_37504/g.118267 Transcript_37504/m.118267 type:complete len:258 (+) Transcript_37504:723-1496(+)